MIGDNKARDLMNALRAAAGEFADYALAKIEDVQPGHSEGLQRRVAGGANVQVVVRDEECTVELVHGPETRVLCKFKGLEFCER
jgi:hypothetical protein